MTIGSPFSISYLIRIAIIDMNTDTAIGGTYWINHKKEEKFSIPGCFLSLIFPYIYGGICAQKIGGGKEKR